MSFGAPIDKNKALPLVENTPWNGMLDLHRLAFADWLPRNSESRSIAFAMRWIRKTYPHIQWVQSYADATQCGDGGIYRASGFSLVQVNKNTSMYRMPDGDVVCKLVLEPGFSSGTKGGIKAKYGKTGSETSGSFLKKIGAERLVGFQLRYIYFLDPEARKRLTVPVLPFSEIQRLGAGMYRGKPSAGSSPVERPTSGGEAGGSIPTPALNVSSV